MPQARGARSTQRGPSRRSSAAGVGGPCFRQRRRRRRRRVEERGPVAQQQARSLRDSLRGGGGTARGHTQRTHMRWHWGDRAAAAPVGAGGSRAWLGTQPWSCALLDGLGNGASRQAALATTATGRQSTLADHWTHSPPTQAPVMCMPGTGLPSGAGTVLHLVEYFWRNAASSACSPAVVTPVCLKSRESRPETSSGFSRLHNGRWNARSTWRPANHMPSQHTSPLAALSVLRA